MRIQSLLIGAAIAAILVLPAWADEGWVNGQWRTYATRSLDLENVAATVKIDVKDSGPMAIQVSGRRERVDGVKVHADGDRLTVECADIGSVWDWRHWFDFSRNDINKPSQLTIHVVVPRGSPVDVEAMAGDVTIGDTMGPLKFEVMGHSESTVGNVSEAVLEMNGSGRLKVGNVRGEAKVETAGSGNIRLGDVGRMNADIAGSGSIGVGRINGSLDVGIAGSGDFSAASVQGPTSASIAGSGSVTIAGGEANPFKVDIMGSGNVSFGGTAVNPSVSSLGSGSVRIKAYRGSFSNEGNAKVNVGG